MPELTLFHDSTDEISFSIGECSKNGPLFTSKMYCIHLKYMYSSANASTISFCVIDLGVNRG